jgi:NADH-quinone oxidoreductase subunit A
VKSATGTIQRSLPLNTLSTQPTEVWPLVAYFFLVVTLVGGVMVLSYVIGERHRSHAADEPFESGIVTVGLARLRLAAKFYLIAVFFVIFDVEAVFLFAWAIAFRELGWVGYIEAFIFIVVLGAALAYLWRLGALDWGPARRSTSRSAKDARSPNRAMVSK